MNSNPEALPYGSYGLATIQGTVTDKDTGKPIIGAMVTLLGKGNPIRRAAVLTDSSGKYKFRKVLASSGSSPIKYIITVSKSGYKSASKEVLPLPGQTLTVDFRLSRKFKLLPDLTVTNIVVEPDPVASNQDVRFTATVKNRGNVPAPISKTAFCLNSSFLGKVQTATLPTGSETTVSFNSTAPTTEGNYTVSAKADYDSQITESNETNNEYWKGFTVVATRRYTIIEYNEAKEDIVEFLISQQNLGTGMIESYEAGDKPYGWLYDNALALIVLTDAGKKNAAAKEAACRLVAAFIAAQEDNSWWWEVYDIIDGRPYTDTSRGSGVLAWMAYALAFYGFNYGDLNAIKAAENYASFCIDNFRDKIGGKFDYWGGYDSAGVMFRFKSFEQNIDIWWLFKILGDFHSHEGRTMSEWAKLLWQELSNPDNGYWNVSEGRWNAGVDYDGIPDTTFVAEDCQSWGAILAYFNRDSTKAFSPLDFSHRPETGLISTISDFPTDLHGIIMVKGFKNFSPQDTYNIWNGGTAHESVALSYLDYSPLEGIDSRYWLDYLMDVQNLSTIPQDPDKAWFHSATNDPTGGYYGRPYGLHVGESCWVYFAINNFLGEELLPYETLWMLRLPVPFYQKEFNCYSAAASSKMVLDYIKEDTILTQDKLYNYGHFHNHFDNFDILDIDPQGVKATLNYYKPEGYNFGIRALDKIADSLRDICHWMDYEVGGVSRPNVPVILPAFGGYSNWMVIRGASASNDPSETDTFTVNGFWVNDPAVSGIGANSYKTAAEWESTYFLPLTTGDCWNGKYVTLAEPPETLSQAKVVIPEICITQLNENLIQMVKSKERLKFKGVLSTSALAEAQMQIEEFTWQSIIDSSLLRDPNFMEAFQGATAGEPIYVRRIDKNNADYYLIPFEKFIGGHRLTSVVFIIDAYQGYFKEASWVSEPVEYPPLAEEGIGWGWKPSEESPSPYYPFVHSRLNIAAKNVSNNQYAPGIDFGVVPSTTYATPSQYVEISCSSNEKNWALEVYTNNTGWTGPGSADRGGLLGQTNTDRRAPMLWQVHNNVQSTHPVLNQCEVGAGRWTWVKDKGDPDWSTSRDYRQVLTGNSTWTWLHDHPRGEGSSSSVTPVVVYFGAVFDSAPPDTYSTTLIFDLYHW